MFRWTFLFLCLALLWAPMPAQAQRGRPDPITETFYPPELLIGHAQEIGLDEQQMQFIASQVREHRKRFGEMQQNLQHQVAALADILRREQPDEQEALAQLDKVLAAEREIKRVQLSLSLSIRNQLTPEQQAKAKEFRQKFLAESHSRQPMEAVGAKMQQLQERIRQLQDEGRDPSAAIHAAQECQQLMQEGKPAEAEAVLHRALGEIQADEKK